MSFANMIFYAIQFGTALLFGATGEIITEKSGNLNLGIPGIMYGGAVGGVVGGFIYQSTGHAIPAVSIIICLLSSMIGSLLMSLIYCFLTVTLRANQNVTGLTLTIFGNGLANYLGATLVKRVGGSTATSLNITETSNFFTASLPFADKLGWFGKIFLSYSFMTYLAIAIALVAAFILKRTRTGLQLRAVGESPATADAAGINVTKYKYFATCIGGMIAGLGGLYHALVFVGVWTSDLIGDIGWLAIAIVIFTIWKPDLCIPGAYLFGGLYILYDHLKLPFLTGTFRPIIKMLPYLVTIIVLIVVSFRKKRETQPPASLGLSYFREER